MVDSQIRPEILDPQIRPADRHAHTHTSPHILGSLESPNISCSVQTSRLHQTRGICQNIIT